MTKKAQGQDPKVKKATPSVYSCQPCNNSKRSKTLMEFAIHRMQPNLIDKSILIQCAAKRAVDRLIPRHASAVN